MLTRIQIKALNVARAVLRRMQEMSRHDMTKEWESGNFSEACNEAEKSLLNVMLIDKHLLGNEEISDADILGEGEA